MAYDGTKLSQLATLFDGTFGMWVYRSADSQATVRAAGYITDATTRGMKVRDLVIVLDTNVPTTYFSTVIAITAGAADLGDGLVVPETNT